MFGYFKRKAAQEVAVRLYDQAVEVARTPVFYAEWGVPDTLDGRFEMIALHVFMLLFRVKNEKESLTPTLAPPAGGGGVFPDILAQAIFDAMFRDIDRSLREMGVGDLGVPKRVKSMMQSMNGRCLTYTRALHPDAPAGALRDAVRRNIYGTSPDARDDQVEKMSAYIYQRIKAMMSGVYHEIETRNVFSDPLAL